MTTALVQYVAASHHVLYGMRSRCKSQ